jgi:RNA polymerase sigma-70 factor (ECF subfamily)
MGSHEFPRSQTGRHGTATSLSLLGRLKSQDREGWQRFVELYAPVIYRWCRQAGIASDEANDIAQEVFAAVMERIDAFRHQRPGDTFRGWLWTIARNKICGHFRARQGEPRARGGTAAQLQLAQVPELPESLPDEDQAETEGLLSQRAFLLVQSQFEDRTWRAFWRTTVDQQPVDQVANEIGISAASVYQARHRVMKRIREEFGELL